MNCPLCGNTYPCVHSRRSHETAAGSGNIRHQDTELQDPRLQDENPERENPEREDDVWREQVASRVLQHRAKRKGSDSDANMELRFPVQEAPVDERIMRARRFVAQAATRSPFADDSSEPSFSSSVVASVSSVSSVAAMAVTAGVTSEAVVTNEPFTMEELPKIIHFPRSSGSQRAAAGTLASVHDYHAAMLEIEAECAPTDSLRITDVAEEADPVSDPSVAHMPAVAYIPDDDPPVVYRKEKTPPAEQLQLPNFDDIQLEATHQAVLPELELGPQPAPLGQRMMAGAVDAAIVLGAAAVFNVTFTQLAEENVHSRMALLCAVAVCGVLWTLYQYTFLVHGIGTPGMHLAHLELANFDGKPVSGFDRRCRAVASALSGFSLGLGFLWALVDEDQLGWHDRMTKTLIRSSVAQPVMARESMW